MATYVPSLKGYITDVPEIWLKRRDNKVFHFDQLTSSNVTPDTQFTEINAGWSLYPVAYLPGQSSMEMTFESAQFDADLFALATNTAFKDEIVEVWGTAVIPAETKNQTEFIVESNKDLTGATFYINGYAAAVGRATTTGAANYVQETTVTGNPKELKLYEKLARMLTSDTVVQSGKDYFLSPTDTTAITQTEGADPAANGWYEKASDATAPITVFVPTEDTTAVENKAYYKFAPSAATGASTAGTMVSGEISETGVHTTAPFNVNASVMDAVTNTYKTRIKLADGDGIEIGDELVVSYVTKEHHDTILVDNQQTFVGEAILRWPVYASGDETGQAGGVKGYVMMHIFKGRCTAMPGFDASYKSNVTNGITISAMDPHRVDGAIYSISFLEN